jgi:hypothetical protein
MLGGNVFFKPDGIGGSGRRVYSKPKIASIPLDLPIPCERLTNGEWGCIKLFADLHQRADGNTLQGTKRILFDCLKLRDELRAYPDPVAGAFEAYMTGAFLVNHHADPVRGFYVYLSDLFTKLSTVRTYLGIKSYDDKVDYILPSLTSDEDWKHYPDQVRDLNKIPIEAENEEDKSTVISAINLIQEDADRAGVSTISRFLGEYVGKIRVDPNTSIDGAAILLSGRSIEIGKNIVALGNLEVATVLLHEAEHHRFEGIVWPLVEFGLITVKNKPGKDYLEANDMDGEHELGDLMSMLSEDGFEQEISERRVSLIRFDRKLFTELFARYRELDYAQLSYPELPDIFYEIDLLEKAISIAFEVDPVMQTVIDRCHDLKVKRLMQRLKEGRIVNPHEGLSRLLEEIRKTR